MELSSRLPHIVRFIPVILACLVLCGCPKPAAEPQFPSQRRPPPHAAPVTGGGDKPENKVEIGIDNQPEKNTKEQVEAKNQAAETGSKSLASEVGNIALEEPVEKPRDLGPPLVDHPETLKKLHPVYPVWIDKDNKKVVMAGEICQTNAPLEMFACTRGTKEHESIVSVPAEAYIVHAALLRVGAKAGKPVEFLPKYVPATGSEIEITVRWKNNKGEVQTARRKIGSATSKPARRWISPGFSAAAVFGKMNLAVKNIIRRREGILSA